jgi:hypothetical protein
MIFRLTPALQLPPGPAIALPCGGPPAAKASMRDAAVSSMEFVSARAREVCRRKDVRRGLRAWGDDAEFWTVLDESDVRWLA